MSRRARANVQMDLRGRTFYHGTTQKAGDKIIAQGFVAYHERPSWTDWAAPSMYGRVYVWTTLSKAKAFARDLNRTMYEGKSPMMVLEVVPSEMLDVLIDEDVVATLFHRKRLPKRLAREFAYAMREEVPTYDEHGFQIERWAIESEAGKHVLAVATDKEMYHILTHAAEADRLSFDGWLPVQKAWLQRASHWMSSAEPWQLVWTRENGWVR